MDAENLAFDDCADSEVVEDLSAVLPRVGVSVLPDGLIVEAVDGRDLASLVVASEESDMGRILKLEAEEQLKGLDRVVAAVYKVSHEDVAGVRDLSSFVE